MGRALIDAEKYAIVEFLKAATHGDYPATLRATPARITCRDRQDWVMMPGVE